jgi:hypothetical protein
LLFARTNVQIRFLRLGHARRLHWLLDQLPPDLDQFRYPA